jgi:GAF domain-containing protein
MPTVARGTIACMTTGTLDYDQLCGTLDALLEGEHDRIASLATAAALLWDELDDVNWVGFYLQRGDELVVGPYQGRPACIRIAAGRGVCGAAAERRETVVVPDVHEFPGHIACDARSRSEVVVPVVLGDELVGVLDVDSPSLARFDDADAAGLEQFVARLLPHL